MYLLFGLAWIWLSDSILAFAGVTGELGFWAASLKGTIFVALSTFVVYLTARREARVQACSARLLEAVVEGTADAIFVKDSSGKYLLFNEGAARLVGRPATEVIGRDDTFLFDPESARRVMERDQSVIARGQLETAEEELTADGVTRTYLATKAPYLDEQGRVAGVVGISLDISDRKRAERALLESEERFRTLVELAPDSIALLLNGRVTFANAAAAKMVGAPTPEAMVGVSLLDHIHPDDRPASLARQAAIAERSEFYPPHEMRVRRLDGEYIEVEVCAGPCVVGGERGIQVIARDVTERNRETAFLTRQNAILERITAGEALPRVLEAIVQLIESLDPGTLGSILLLDREGRLRQGAAPGLPAEYNLAIDGVRIGSAVGSCGTAAYTRSPVFATDIATDSRWVNYAPLALGHGLRACWSVPIFAPSRGEDIPDVLGTFAVYARTPRSPTPRLIELLNRVEHLASIAIARDRADREVRESEDRFRTLVANATDSILLHDEHGVVVDVNEWACESLGYTREELIGRSPIDFDDTVTPEGSEELAAKLRDGELVTFEGVHRRKDGSKFPVEVRVRQFFANGRRQGLSFVRDISERKRAERRLAVQHAVASTLADSDHLREAAPTILRTICETLGWTAGGLWMLDREQSRLALVDVWGEGEGVTVFLNVSRQLTFTRGVGLPGRVWERAAGVWVPDVTSDPTFVRREEAIGAGFRGAFAFPIRSGGKVIGVVDFYHTQTAAPDEELLRVFEVLGNQIGQFVERNRSRAALRESEGRLRLFVEHAPAALAMFDRDMRYMIASRRWTSDYRLDAADLVGRSHYEIFPEIPAEWRAVHTRALAGEVLRADRDSFVRADGTTQWLRWEVRPWYNTAGDVGGIVMFADDITTTVLGEVALRENEERFRRLVDSIMDGVISIDAQQQVILFNPAAERMFGLSAGEVIGKPLDLLIPVRHREAHVAHVEAFRRNGATSRSMGELGSITALRKGGEEFPIEASISQIDVGGRRISTAIVRDISARVRADLDLRESEERFRATFEQAAVGLAHVNLEGQFLRVNERLAEITGYSREELLANTFQMITHPDDLTVDLALGDRLLAGDIPHYSLEKRYLRKDGGVVWVNLTVSVRRDGNGLPLHFISVVEDIAARKVTEAALRESEARFRNVFEYAAVGIGITQADGRFLQCNPEYCRILGRTEEELKTADLQELIHPDDRAENMTLLRQLAVGEINRYELTNRFLLPSGDSVWVHKLVTNMGDGIERERRLMALITDLTEQRQLEAQLRHQELMIREAGELAHVGGWGFDPLTGQGDWTAETARIHGLDPTASTAVAQGLSFFSGSDREQIEAAVADAAAHGTPYDLELQLTAIDGQRKWVRTICRPIVDNGRVVRVRGSIQDITDRKRAEEVIRGLNAGLEQRVRERTVELQAVNRELESFSYSVSHDLRAPIRHIAAFTGLVLESDGPRLPPESREHLEQVMKASRRMGYLVDDLLRFSRLGRQPVRRLPIDTRRLVEDCLREVTSVAEPRRLNVHLGELSDCVGDIALLRQVWVNLLANAIKYSGPRDPAVIEVGEEITTEGPAYFVRDNGVGFDMAYAHKLFGVFQRLHRAEEFEGTGIGLALVQRIIHRHGGRVWAHSVPGHGATFYFTLNESPDNAEDSIEPR